jgi:hypothetical protein
MSAYNRPDTRKCALVIVILTSFLPPFMTSPINIALQAIGAEFSMDAILLGWIATGSGAVKAERRMVRGQRGQIRSRRIGNLQPDASGRYVRLFLSSSVAGRCTGNWWEWQSFSCSSAGSRACLALCWTSASLKRIAYTLTPIWRLSSATVPPLP